MPTVDPSLEVLIDLLVASPGDKELRKSVRDFWEQRFADTYPNIIRRGVVLRASLPSLSVVN